MKSHQQVNIIPIKFAQEQKNFCISLPYVSFTKIKVTSFNCKDNKDYFEILYGNPILGGGGKFTFSAL